MKQRLKTEEDRQSAISFIKYMDLNKAHRLTIVQIRHKRSIDQNSLLWLWLTALERDSETGYTKDDFYQMFLELFAPRKLVFSKACIISSSNMNTLEMTMFLHHIQDWTIQTLSFQLPDPDNYKFDEFLEHYRDYL